MGVEVVERRRAAGGEAGELDERLVDVHVLLPAAGLVDTGGAVGLADAQHRPGMDDARAGSGVEAHEGAQGAVGGLGAGIEVDAHPALVAGGVTAISAGLAGVAGLVAALEPGAS